MKGNGTNPPGGTAADETPMRFPRSRTATEKRVDLLWKPPHTPRARVLLDRAERNAEAMTKASASQDAPAKNATERPSPASDSGAPGPKAKGPDGSPAAD